MNVRFTQYRHCIIRIATSIQCINCYVAAPVDYRGMTFDDAAYREEHEALAEKKRHKNP
jgi:hypothetical protein